MKNKRYHRVKCTRCNKRFGNDVIGWNLLQYQQKIKKILYELFILKYPTKGVAIRWEIPPEMISRFKKSFVSNVFQQNANIIEHEIKALPRGVMLADETFMGSRGNSNIEIVVINDMFQILSTESAIKGNLKKSILKAFNNIPPEVKKKLKILITDGEPSYESIGKEFGGGIIHLVQFHAHDKRGEIVINKYEELGPHYIHYKIYTHWKAFYRDKHELKFKWEIKLIKGRVQAKRGRPQKTNNSQNSSLKWRQKLKTFQSASFKKETSAKLLVNFKTNKLSMRAGAKKWMIQLLTLLFKIFKGKHATTNLIESKHSQVKGNGAVRKQKDLQYGHQLFTLHAFIVEHDYIPFTFIAGRPLYNYLMKDEKNKELGYEILEGKQKFIQTVLSAFE